MHCSANVDDEGRGGDLLRPVGDGQDDALGRSRAAPDRRRRARLGTQRRLQLRGRVLREGDQPLGRGRAARSSGPHTRTGRCSRTSSPTSAACSTSTTTRRRRTPAPHTSSSRSTNALPEKRAGHPSSTWSSLPRTPSASSRRSRGSTRDQALFYFLSGFTAKLAGTEIGVDEPQPTFSPCFGAPFLPQPPTVVRGDARDKLDEHGAGSGCQHGLDGRAVRRGGAHADRRHARAPPRRAERRARRRRTTAWTRSSASRFRSRYRVSTRSSSIRARPGATPLPTTSKAESSRACSGRTSSSSPRSAESWPRGRRAGRALTDLPRRRPPSHSIASRSGAGEA